MEQERTDKITVMVEETEAGQYYLMDLIVDYKGSHSCSCGVVLSL